MAGVINPERNHFRIEMRVVIEAASAEEALEKMLLMFDHDFIKDWSREEPEPVAVSWTKEG